MNAGAETIGRAGFAALGTSALVVVADQAGLDRAKQALRRTLTEIDRTCSRFRDDSEISRLHHRAGWPTIVSPLLAEVLEVALRAAAVTDGLVDPTVGAAMVSLGYDRDFAEVSLGDPRPAGPAAPAPGWWRLRFDPDSRQVVLPRHVLLDLGATAKALAADIGARAAAEEAGCGALVSLGGDVAVAGEAPAGGWHIGIGDDHVRAAASPDTTITIVSGGVATSSTTRRQWRRGDRLVHHIVDPRTGDAVVPTWRAVSVAAATCADANASSTAAIVLGEAAPSWLRERGLPARLAGVDGRVITVAGWPAEQQEPS